MAMSVNRRKLHRIVVLNPKGGCGKTSLATNLVSCIARHGAMPVLFDCDPQGAGIRWLEKRPKTLAPIHGIAAFRHSPNVTRTWQLRVPAESRHVVVDTPAGLESPRIHDLVYDATSILIPIMPSAIDIRYAARFIAELLLFAQLDRGSVQVGIVANRTRGNTLSLRQLMRFLTSLRLPVISDLRDSQNFVRAADEGLGVCDLPAHRAKADAAAIERIIAWLETGRAQDPNRSVAALELPAGMEEWHPGH